jgi:hypothetical protein
LHVVPHHPDRAFGDDLDRWVDVFHG